MTRSRATGIAIVVVLAAASGTAAASNVRSAGRTTTSVAHATPTAAKHAFVLPDLSGAISPAVISATVDVANADRQRHAQASHPHARHHAARPVPQPRCPGLTPSPHFATPQEAMQYLATAWNHHDLDALCHVTDPQARQVLDAMHSEAVHLRLAHCHLETVGLYGCVFRHDYPRHLHAHGVGHAYMQVAAALTPGWYTRGSVGCG